MLHEVTCPEVQRFYLAGLHGLRILDARSGKGRHFGPEADARWSGFAGHLRLGDRIDKNWVYCLGLLSQAIAGVCLLLTRDVTMLYVYAFFVTWSVGGISPQLPGICADRFGRKNMGAIYGFAFFLTTIGTGTGPVFAGWIFDTTGSYQIAFITMIVISIIGAIMMALARPVGPPKGAQA